MTFEGSSAKLPSAIVEVARAEIGVKEVAGSNTGPRVNQYKESTWLNASDPWPWCAAFVCWVVMKAMEREGVEATDSFKRPTTPRAYGLEDWSLKQDNSTSTRRYPGQDIKAGDIVIFNFSHVGFAVGDPYTDTKGVVRVQTVEGNTNEGGSREGDGVYPKSRRVSKIRSRIRFNV